MQTNLATKAIARVLRGNLSIILVSEKQEASGYLYRKPLSNSKHVLICLLLRQDVPGTMITIGYLLFFYLNSYFLANADTAWAAVAAALVYPFNNTFGT